MAMPYAEVIGDPIAHSKSPLIHRFWLGKLGLEGDYRAVRVAPSELPDWLAARRGDPDWRGCSVTIPHKLSIAKACSTGSTIRVGAVNCVLPRAGRLVGRNTERGGRRGGRWAMSRPGAPVCLIGAGGGAPLINRCRAGRDGALASTRIIARGRAAGRDLLDGLAMEGAVVGFEDSQEALDGCAGIINASPVGMAGFPVMPEAVLNAISFVRPGGFVLDMVYGSATTPLIEQAERSGLKAKDGLAMLTGQAKQAFHYFFEAAAPSEHDGALRRLLAP